MKFTEYQTFARDTAIYPEKLSGVYPALGLAGEAGEVCEKVKKLHRDKDGEPDAQFIEDLTKELGDVLWYVSNLAWDYGIDLGHVATINLAKLQDRKLRNTLKGSGDDR